jgi:PleD family two-component response regulator
LNRLLVETELSSYYPTHFPQSVGKALSNLEASMSLKVVLAIGVDSSLLEMQSSAWKSSGYIVIFAWSIKEAITHFHGGDFDLVLLGQSLPAESRERLTFLIRASGSRVPVIYISDSPSDCDSFADATVNNAATSILEEIGELMASRAKMPAAGSAIARLTT